MKDPTEILHTRFHMDEFRPGQLEVIETVASGRDTLLVMPTGGGKSICFQVPALMLDGVTLVVSPLIALMQDQVDALDAKGVESTFLNSSISKGEYDDRLERVLDGTYKLVYVAPERFGNRAFMESLQNMDVSLLVVDEAHCISSWGHDFRPDYRRLGEIREKLGVPVLAVTATATPEVRKDIQAQLRMKDQFVKVTGFDRPNLKLTGKEFSDEYKKRQALRRIIHSILDKVGDDDTVPSVIIYCGTKKLCKEVSDDINAIVFKDYGVGEAISEYYHAELTPKQRLKVQEDWASGEKPWVVATIAFGMGIDKADVRHVLHYTIPGTVEAYYQEVGRAGRDGEKSTCHLFYCEQDIDLREYFIACKHPPEVRFQQVHGVLRRRCNKGQTIRMTYKQIAKEVMRMTGYDGIVSGQVGTCMTLLKRHGLFTAPRRGQIRMAANPPTLASMKIDYADIQRRKARELLRLEQMKSLVEAKDKKEFIRDYFGEGK
jgi:ATP-dependent DNA helicase RecQ